MFAKRRKLNPQKEEHLVENRSPLNWFDLPFEMREMVIDEMDARTRGNFAQCSRLCEKEAKESKFYLCSIKIDNYLNRQLYIGDKKLDYQYCLEFVDIPHLTSTQSIVIYKTTGWRLEDETGRVVKWMKTENGNAEDVRKKYLREILEKYKKTIRHIIIEDEDFTTVDVSFKDIRNLGLLHVLKSSFDGEDLIQTECLTAEQISRMKLVKLPNTHVKFEDILKFKGYMYHIRTTDFYEDNLKKYLKMWKNGELYENLISICVMDYDLDTLSRRNIAEGLDVFYFEEIDTICRFRFQKKYQRKEGDYTEVVVADDFIKISQKMKVDNN